MIHRSVREPDFGRRLAAFRADRGLTQCELATAIGKTRATVSHWEAGRAYARSRDLAGIARALDCRIRGLLAPVEAPLPPRPPGWTRRRASRLSNLSDVPTFDQTSGEVATEIGADFQAPQHGAAFRARGFRHGG